MCNSFSKKKKINIFLIKRSTFSIFCIFMIHILKGAKKNNFEKKTPNTNLKT